MDFSSIPTPAEAARPTPELEAEVEALTAWIAKRLQNYNPEMPVTIGATGHSRRVWNIVIAGLRSRGWHAEWVNDQRDGDFISIRPAGSAVEYYAK